MERTYLCCDLKSYYASVECIDRGLDPMAINLVVADAARTDKTICLAVSPALKSFGLSGRPRLFEVKQRVRDINYERRMRLPSKAFWDKSCDLRELQNDPTLELDYIIAPPRMRRYMEVSAKIHGIFLKYFSAEDIHVYSIDEVFVDLTAYLPFYRLSAHALAERVVNAVFQTTGITATVGIGTNLYLAKIAMDILAKKCPQMRRGCGLRSWMKCHTAMKCGRMSRFRILACGQRLHEKASCRRLIHHGGYRKIFPQQKRRG